MQARGPSLLAKAAIFAIRIYRNILSNNMLHSCKFIPNCSSYAEQALQHHGLFTAATKTAFRILHCHPFSPGGYDPV